jgi:hypothetical protein
MIIVIRTQYRENYGHQFNPYWKNKGGADYKVVNVPLDMDPQQIVDTVKDDIEYFEPYSEEYILNWSIEDDTYLSDFEKSQLEFDGKITHPEPKIYYEELING